MAIGAMTASARAKAKANDLCGRSIYASRKRQTPGGPKTASPMVARDAVRIATTIPAVGARRGSTLLTREK